jgi:hypothetical protein
VAKIERPIQQMDWLFLFFSWQIYLLGWQAAGVRDMMAVSRKPSIAEMDHAIETGEAEKSVERPRPPDFPRDEQIDIRSGNQLPIGREQSNVREQLFARHIYFVSDPRLVEGGDCKSAAFQSACPEPHPARAETALAVVKDDSARAQISV